MTKRKQYTKEFKLDAVNLVLEQGYGRAETARRLGINSNMLARWEKELTENNDQAFRGNGKLTAEQEEIKHLRATVKRLEMEKEILKKATVFFAKETT
jgi:transposase